MLKTKIKAGSITNLTDARYFAAREVEWLGFDFSAGSDTFIAPAQMLAIREWVDGVKLVGEFHLESLEEIRAAISDLKLDAVQLSMVAMEATLRSLIGEIEVFQEIVPEYYHRDEDLRDQFAATPADLTYILLNLEKNGFTWQDLLGGTPFSLAELKTLCARYPVVLALDFQPEEVNEIITALPVKGLHLRGGVEEKVGIKSFDDLDEILDLLEQG